jgi:hypothetical protein
LKFKAVTMYVMKLRYYSVLITAVFVCFYLDSPPHEVCNPNQCIEVNMEIEEITKDQLMEQQEYDHYVMGELWEMEDDLIQLEGKNDETN